MARTSDMFGALTLYVTLLIFYPFLSNAQAKNHVALFIFGDSLYDTGMTLYNGVKGAGAEFWPYGETYFKKPAGRYSDGRIIPDFIAQFAGLPLPKPYLLPGLNDYTNGVNFASASACVLVGIRPQTINLKMQVDYFKQMVQKLKQQVGQKKAKNMLSKSVYLFNIGGNDYVSLLQKNVKKLPLSPSTKKLYMNQVLGNFTHHIKTIHNQGGRKFAFQNIGPLGCMPAEKNRLGSKGACAVEPQKLAKMHNAAFLATVNKLASQLSGFKYSVYDSFASSSLRLQNGNKYGFKETKTACCGTGVFNGAFTCSNKGTNFTVCSNPNDYLWFDAGHYTQKANKQFSKEFWSGGSNVVAPYNLNSLFIMD